MVQISIWLLLILFTSQKINAQFENWPLGTRAASMANAYVGEADLWSVHHNQAGLGFYPHFAVGFHHENKFLVDEYSLHAVSMTVPVKSGTLGFSYNYFGYNVYNQSKFGIGYGKQLGNGFAAGVQINYHFEYLEGEIDNGHALSVEAGLQYKPGEQFTIGAHVSNPTRARSSAYEGDTIPTYFNLGISYYPVSEFRLNMQVNKGIDRELRILGGMEFLFMENLYARAGYMIRPNHLTFGLGYKLGKISADIGFTHHAILGFTPHFSFQAILK